MLNRINPKNFYKYFFYLFIFAIPLQTRKVFLTEYSFYTGAFTESGSIFVYLTDLLLVSALLSYALWNRDNIKASLTELNSKSKHQEKRIIGAIFILGAWCFLSAALSQEYLTIAIFRSFKMIEMATLSFFIYLCCNDRRIALSSLFIIILSAIFQSIVAILQFLLQHSVFISPLLHILTGETILSPDLPGIAKIAADGDAVVRSYGTFPHPNLLGGFLVISLMISLYLFLCHHDDYLSSLLDSFKIPANRLRKSLISSFWLLALTLQSTALLFTFSRSAWLGAALSLATLCLIYRKDFKIVSRETIRRVLHYKELCVAGCILLIILSLNAGIFFNRATEDTAYPQDINHTAIPQNSTFSDRMFFNIVSRETILDNPIWGSGTGTSLFQINDHLQRNKSVETMEAWQYQPTHNIYLLIASEIGLIGFLIFCFIISKASQLAVKKIVSRETIQTHRVYLSFVLSCFTGLLLIGMFDHYLMTLQQGQLLFWLIIGLLLL